MEKNNKNKGLSDNQEGEFILNESGTSVSIDAPGEGIMPETKTDAEDIDKRKETEGE